MAPLNLTPHPRSDDFELQLAGSARLNPAMVRQIKQEYEIDLGTMDVAQLANSMSRLDPEPVIERMRASAGRIPGMTIESKYFISTFADLKESMGSYRTPRIPRSCVILRRSKFPVRSRAR